MRRRNGRHGQGETGHGATFWASGGVFRHFAFDIKRRYFAVVANHMNIADLPDRRWRQRRIKAKKRQKSVQKRMVTG